MKDHSVKDIVVKNEQFPLLYFLLKWMTLSTVVGMLVGSASAILLISLEWAASTRESNLWIIWLLPIGGLVSGLMYHHLGKRSEKGNNLIIEESLKPSKIIPILMAPLVLIGTIITHLLGGSAGREGTAVQMGGSIADQFSRFFKIDSGDRKILLVMGISAGFASVFGTPLAGSVFALEVLILGRMRYEAIIPSFLVAIVANYACDLWPIHHTHYSIPSTPELTPLNMLWAILAGIIFGLTALLFSKSTHSWGKLFKTKIHYPPMRPFIGGAVVALAVYLIGTTKYIGLGVPTIVESFNAEMNPYDFLVKILFTSFTLGAGFKGGEVTPLFYIGATLGNALIWFVPLPMPLLAGMGFVAVFSGATNTPIACTLMGIELFGAESGVYIAIACVVAYLFSGHSGIYASQMIGSPKHFLFQRLKGKSLGNQKSD